MRRAFPPHPVPKTGWIMSNKPEYISGRLERWLIPVLIFGFCGGAFWLTTTFKKMPPILKRGIQPSDFPQLLIALLVLLTIFMVLKDPIRIKERLQNKTTGTIFLFAIFAALTSIDLFLALGIAAGALAAFWGERRGHVLAIITVVMPIAIFLLFDQVFEIRFPRGLLTNLWYG